MGHCRRGRRATIVPFEEATPPQEPSLRGPESSASGPPPMAQRGSKRAVKWRSRGGSSTIR